MNLSTEIKKSKPDKKLTATVTNELLKRKDYKEAVVLEFIDHHLQIQRSFSFTIKEVLPPDLASKFSEMHILWLAAFSFSQGRTLLRHPQTIAYVQSLLDLGLRLIHLDQTDKPCRNLYPKTMSEHDCGVSIIDTRTNIAKLIDQRVTELLLDEEPHRCTVAEQLLCRDPSKMPIVPRGIRVCKHGMGYEVYPFDEDEIDEDEQEITEEIHKQQIRYENIARGLPLNSIDRDKFIRLAAGKEMEYLQYTKKSPKEPRGPVIWKHGICFGPCHCGTTPCTAVKDSQIIRLGEKGETLLEPKDQTIEDLEILARMYTNYLKEDLACAKGRRPSRKRQYSMSVDKVPSTPYEQPHQPMNVSTRLTSLDKRIRKNDNDGRDSRYNSRNFYNQGRKPDRDAHQQDWYREKEEELDQYYNERDRFFDEREKFYEERDRFNYEKDQFYKERDLVDSARDAQRRGRSTEVQSNQRNRFQTVPIVRFRSLTPPRPNTERKEPPLFNYGGYEILPHLPHYKRADWYSCWTLNGTPNNNSQWSWERRNPRFYENTRLQEKISEQILTSLNELEKVDIKLARQLISTTNFRYFTKNTRQPFSRPDPMLSHDYGPGEIAILRVHELEEQLEQVKAELEQLKNLH